MIKRSILPSNIYQRGFTIVELLVVIVVIGILAAITIVSYTGISQRATVASIQSDLTNASNILKLDQVTGGAFPVDIASANTNKGISSCTGTTTCIYAVNNSITPQGFCLAVTKNLTTYRITNDSSPTAGDCQSYGLQVSLDAGNTTSYPSPFTGTTWNDLSGNGRHGTLVNGPTYDGNNSGSIVFDGINDRITTLANVGVSGNFPISISSWFKTIDNSIAQSVVTYGSSVNGTTFGLYLSNGSAGIISAEFQSGTGVKTAAGTLLNNTWTNVVITKSPGMIASTTSVYVNGALVSSPAYNGGTNIPNFNFVYGGLGSWNDGGQSFFKGNISTAQVYNRTLSAAEVLQYFNASKARYGL